MFNKRKSYLVFGSPLIEEPEVQEVVDTLKSGWLGTGPKVTKFEDLLIGKQRKDTKSYLKYYKENLVKLKISQSLNVAINTIKLMDGHISGLQMLDIV